MDFANSTSDTRSKEMELIFTSIVLGFAAILFCAKRKRLSYV